jgi:hypothetical protein
VSVFNEMQYLVPTVLALAFFAFLAVLFFLTRCAGWYDGLAPAFWSAFAAASVLPLVPISRITGLTARQDALAGDRRIELFRQRLQYLERLRDWVHRRHVAVADSSECHEGGGIWRTSKRVPDTQREVEVDPLGQLLALHPK